MFTFELHDDEIHNVTQGTLLARTGKYFGHAYEYQAAMALGEHIPPLLSRAYILDDGVPVSAWDYGRNSAFRCIGYTPDSMTARDLFAAHIYPDAMLIALTERGVDVRNVAEAHDWARGSLVGCVATAIVYDETGIVAAWENEEGFTSLVARGPVVQHSPSSLET